MLLEVVHRRVKLLVLKLIITAFPILVLQSSVHAGQSITLAWDASGDSSAAGYKIYYGTTSRNYTNSVDVGNVTNATLNLPETGVTYYFAATTYDSAGNESDFSNETTGYVAQVSSVASALTAVTSGGGQFGFTVTGTFGASYIVQASTNMADWVSVETNAAPFNFVDVEAASYPQRFYRTVAL